MRLKKIKLAGFKSFVDPTTVPLPSALVAIVGPNGCGKSNIIDAVRWVMGESSAKHLRGESMADVIFNGSNSRKPVSQASIELVFDNSDGGLGGQYAKYAEISVKRQVNRDGQSQYFLNGTRCRKRDITDVFLGTGLGPRSYSIIEQGMISRVIEAKPEELRVYLEEAAGISLYKERRRETERRMRGTRENMERLTDVREEVGSQLDKLKRQAAVAERYKALKQEERQLRAELLVLRLGALEDEMQRFQQTLSERENALQAEITRQREAEREIVQVRENHTEGNDRLNEIQGRYYALGSEIARIEQQIAHHRELREKQQRDLSANAEALEELERTARQDQEKLAVLKERLEDLEPRIEEAQELEAEASDHVIDAQQALDAWQARWEEFNRQAAEYVQQAQVERTRIDHLDHRQQDLQRRGDRLREESQRLDPAELEAELETLREEAAEAAEQAEEFGERLEECQQRLAELREQQDELNEELADLKGEMQRDQGRLTSLETLQQAALGEAEGPVADWMAEHGLAANARLAHALEVEPGWEQALETVLGDSLQGVCVDGLDLRREQLGGLTKGRVTLIDTAAAPAEIASSGSRAALADKVKAPWPVDDLLAGVYCVPDYDQALAARAGLAPGESLVTPEGIWLSRRWLRIRGEEDAQSGVLAREREIESLRERLAASDERIEVVQRSLEEAQERLLDAEEERDDLRRQREDVSHRQASVQARLESRQTRLRELRERRERLLAEIEDLDAQGRQAGEELTECRERLQESMDRSEDLDEQREQLRAEKERHQQTVNEAREQMRHRREARHDLSLKLESATTARQSIDEQLRRIESQRERIKSRDEELRAALAEAGDPTGELSEQRQRLLAERLETEESLKKARDELADLDRRLRELDQTRAQADQRGQGLRQELEEARLAHQELRVRRQTLAEQLAETGHDLLEVQQALPAGAEEQAWHKRLQDVEGRIARLGSINLAAIEEHKALEERKGYLDQQHDDLTEALETLESAIRKIDRETRARFKETFDKVNAGLSQMYPRLFGGGEAYLELTSDDLLETGVAIMARPPGKRISNIHLLSGGEKALTAVALVFAIFELNPAPFCMLDEVDAPLDEANVGRFCNLVRDMSERVQFIFISHNKATMEIATHLTGVTMHEPGVSRLVAVDVEEAVQMATA